MEQRMEGIKAQARLIEQTYHRGYNAGYSKAENDYHAKTEDDRQSSYELGLNMAWEAARKVIEMGEYRRKWEVFPECGDGEYPFDKVSASEAIVRIKAYEEKKQEEDEIKVGDEIKCENSCAVVTWTDGTYWNGIQSNHRKDIGKGFTCRELKYWEKTGRYFSEIAEVLKKMKEGEE